MSGDRGLFRRVLDGDVVPVPPIWMMRQAGRYHRPYQALRARYSFDELCKRAELSAEVALAPVRDFDFDAAILFSDLLYPLQAVGFGLSYDDGPPAIDGRLDEARLRQFRPTAEAVAHLMFQRDALAATRAALPATKALLGFVGGPWTLFVYAMEGTHTGSLERALDAPGLYREFADRLVPILTDNVRLQFDGGADLVMILDTAAGELPSRDFAALVSPDLARLADAFPGRLGYYAKGRTSDHLAASAMAAAPWAGIGIDHTWDLAAALRAPRLDRFVQGNFDPACLAADPTGFRRALDRFLEPLRPLGPATRRGWICGLGHGVLPRTPEEHVKQFVGTVREAFA